MAEYVTLMGAEQVQSAGRNIAQAAETMSSAASCITAAADQIRQVFYANESAHVGAESELEIQRATDDAAAKERRMLNNKANEICQAIYNASSRHIQQLHAIRRLLILISLGVSIIAGAVVAALLRYI